jgi:hypothetical protein
MLVKLQYYQGDQIKEDEMDGSCSTPKRNLHKILDKNLIEGDNLEDLGADRR